jgi:hypothetical protein
MMEWLDWCCGIRDPFWGTLGWLLVGWPIAYFYAIIWLAKRP